VLAMGSEGGGGGDNRPTRFWSPERLSTLDTYVIRPFIQVAYSLFDFYHFTKNILLPLWLILLLIFEF
jgi:hypothetical protein